MATGTKQLTLESGSPPATSWSLVSGPTGMSLSNSGLLSWTDLPANSYDVSYMACNDNCCKQCDITFTVNIAKAETE